MAGCSQRTIAHVLGDSLIHRDNVLIDSDGSRNGVEILDSIDRLAASLEQLGCRRVGLIADNGIPWIIADLACQQANICLLPLPTFFSTQQNAHALEDAGVDTLLIGSGLNWANLCLPLSVTTWTTYPETCEGLAFYKRPDSVDSVHRRLPENTGKITYTSGSTGSPKGVCLSNSQLLDQAKALADAVAIPGTRHLCLLPLSVLLENVAGVYTALINEGNVIVPSLASIGLTGSSTLDLQKLLASLDLYQPQTLILIPQLLVALVRACESGWTVPASLRFIAVGGGKVAPGLIQRARNFGLPVYEGFGLSECASVVSLNTPDNDRIGSVGKPLPRLNVRAVDGELAISGNPFLGYVNDPQSWYPTTISSGDLGRVDVDGFLYLDGRKKNLLITSYGRNISPEWIESELLSVLTIQDAVVVGDAKPWLVALILPHDTRTTDSAIQTLIQTINASLPDYAKIGDWVRIEQPLNQIPGLTTATGKPRRDAIFGYFEADIERIYQNYSPANIPLEVANS